MPSTSRQPTTPWELRIDFEGISRAQARRRDSTLKELRELLREIERRTLFFVRTKLVRGKARTEAVKYVVPLQARYRAILRKRLTAAYRRGVRDVATEVDLKKPVVRGPQLSQARARADALAQDQLTKLKTELLKAWQQALVGVLDKKQLAFVTSQVFADFAGWEGPVEP